MKKSQYNCSQTSILASYNIGRTIGKGNFGSVKIARDKSKGKPLAIKIFKKKEVWLAQQTDHVFNEVTINSQISHPFIVNFFKMCQDSKHIYLIFQLVNGGDLYSLLNKLEKFNSETCKFYSAIVIQFIKYLHCQQIIYRDIKPENFLIAGDGYLKIIDFGFSKKIGIKRTYTICGTPEYLAPEIIKNKGHGMAVDWWGLGILLYEMCTGNPPFTADDPMVIYRKILKGKYCFDKNFDPQIKSLISNLLMIDLSKRYGNLSNGVNDIKQHQWFQGFDWQKLNMKIITPPYLPQVKGANDLINFEKYPSSICKCSEIISTNDPFLYW